MYLPDWAKLPVPKLRFAIPWNLAQHLGIASYELLMATGYLAYNLYSQGRVDEAWQLAEGALWSYTGNPDAYEAFVCRSVLAMWPSRKASSIAPKTCSTISWKPGNAASSESRWRWSILGWLIST